VIFHGSFGAYREDGGTAEMHGARYVAVNLWLAMCGSHADARLLLVLVEVTHSTVYGR
jgi:hypothetical protein